MEPQIFIELQLINSLYKVPHKEEFDSEMR